MRIIQSAESQTVQEESLQPVDLLSILSDFQDQYRNVFMIQLEGHVFIYRSLGRAEYKKLIMEESLTEYEKQDIICEVCTLYPPNFDFGECSAGLPDILHKKIIANSFLDSVESRQNVLTYYRSEMFQLENQIACIINEAFPQIDVEEIEQWDTEKTMKYLSRAEWKLANLRGMPFVDSTGAYESFYPPPPEEQLPEPVQETGEAIQESAETRRGGSKDNKLTPEKIAEMKELQRKFPEIDFFGDTILNEGMEAMEDSFDNVAPALRPGF